MCACALRVVHVFGRLPEHIRNQHMRKLVALHDHRVVLLWWFGGSTERPGGLAKFSLRLMNGPWYRRRPRFFHHVHMRCQHLKCSQKNFLTHLGGLSVSSAGCPSSSSRRRVRHPPLSRQAQRLMFSRELRCSSTCMPQRVSGALMLCRLPLPWATPMGRNRLRPSFGQVAS